MSPCQPILLPLPAGDDNLIWCLPTAPDHRAVVDPGDAAPVLSALESQGATLSHILLTHHHDDHTAGVAALRSRWPQCQVWGAQADAGRLPPLDLALHDGQQAILGPWGVTVLATPGHTSGHVTFLLDQQHLLAGDCLFAYGCGRLFEDSPAQLWSSLRRLRDLPGEIQVYPAHEYTVANLRFALSLTEDAATRASLDRLLEEACQIRASQGCTLPVSMEQQRRFNPFMQCDQPRRGHFRGAPAGATPEAFCGWLRECRNQFR
ncbi:MAG: hydroxyacylglutathione hydrolase [Magnetococcus sp. WYHC-3]